MSQEAVEAVLNHSESKGAVRLLMLTIAHHIKPESRRCQISADILSRKSGLDRTRVRRAVRALEQLNELEVTVGGGRTVNSYAILLPMQTAHTSYSQLPTREKARRSSAYRDWRTAVLKRDCYACKKCGESEDLHAHHIRPFAAFPELRFDVDNGITLCELCHSDVAGVEIESAAEFLALIDSGAGE